MARPRTLQNVFLGMQRDRARNRLPAGAVWDVIDMLPEMDGPLSSRAGWAYANSADAGTATDYMRAGLYATFSPTAGSDPDNLAVDEDGNLYEISTGGALTFIGGVHNMAQNPVFHGGTSVSGTTAATAAIYTGLAIFTDADGLLAPKIFDGGSILRDMATSAPTASQPPRARYAAVYKDYTVLGNGATGATASPDVFPNRIWFSPPGDPDCHATTAGWDLTDSWIDFSLPVKGFGSTKNTLLVFHDTHVSRIRGSEPPPDEDMVVDDPWLKVGLFDAFSITEHDEFVYWCAPEGVFRTDGVSHENLTKKGGMLSYWLDTVAPATSAWTFATGIQRNFLFVTIKSAVNGAVVDTLVMNLDNFAWFRMSNMPFVSYWSGQSQDGLADELYAAVAASGQTSTQTAKLDGIWDEPSGAIADGNSTAVLPTVETGFFEVGRPALKRFRRAYVGYDIADSGVSSAPEPALAISATFDMGQREISWTLIDAAMDVGQGGAYERHSYPLNQKGEGVAFKIAMSTEGTAFGLHDIGVEVIYLEESRVEVSPTYPSGGQVNLL